MEKNIKSQEESVQDQSKSNKAYKVHFKTNVTIGEIGLVLNYLGIIVGEESAKVLGMLPGIILEEGTIQTPVK